MRRVPRLHQRRLVLPSRLHLNQLHSDPALPNAGNRLFCDALGVSEPFTAAKSARGACGGNTKNSAKRLAE